MLYPGRSACHIVSLQSKTMVSVVWQPSMIIYTRTDTHTLTHTHGGWGVGDKRLRCYTKASRVRVPGKSRSGLRFPSLHVNASQLHLFLTFHHSHRQYL